MCMCIEWECGGEGCCLSIMQNVHCELVGSPQTQSLKDPGWWSSLFLGAARSDTHVLLVHHLKRSQQQPNVWVWSVTCHFLSTVLLRLVTIPAVGKNVEPPCGLSRRRKPAICVFYNPLPAGCPVCRWRKQLRMVVWSIKLRSIVEGLLLTHRDFDLAPEAKTQTLTWKL